MLITVVICTRNPNSGRLARVLEGLRGQSLPASEWELLIVDNGSKEAVPSPQWPSPLAARVITEPRSGLFYARLAALANTRAPLIVFIDDDTVPDAGCLRALRDAFVSDALLVAAGPRICPDYLEPPPPWLPEFAWALAIRDLGSDTLKWSLSEGTPLPHFTPIGAGLALRASAVGPYLEHARSRGTEILKRSWIGQGCGGNEDKDLVLTLVRAGGKVGYVPDAVLHHIIPPERLRASYFESLLPGLNYLWMRTLHAHGLPAHAPIPAWTLPLRSAKAWLRCKAWRRPAPHLRWLASVGVFRGLAANHRDPVRYPTPAPFKPANE